MEADRCDDRAKDGTRPLPPPVTCRWTQRLSAICHPVHTSGDRACVCVCVCFVWSLRTHTHSQTVAKRTRVRTRRQIQVIDG